MKKQIPQISSDYGIIAADACVGFSEIPEQVREHSIVEGFRINLLVVSRRGLGASTLINSLFSAPLVQKDRPDSITTTVNDLVEARVKLTVSITSYHGDDLGKVFKHITALNEEYFEMEQGSSTAFTDKRIHCCLYLVPSDKISEHELQDLKELTMRANVIPLITKADMFTEDELREHRSRISNLFASKEMCFYNYGEIDPRSFPMAVIASETVSGEDEYPVRGRRYPWGFIDIENERFSDFKKLQRILICERFVDLIKKTDAVFYAEVRAALMKGETPGSSKLRILKLLEQTENEIDKNYQQKIRALEAEQSILRHDSCTDIIQQTSEVSILSE